MQIVLLSGGSGKRLWPLSNDAASKQFLKLLPGPNGSTESMVQRIDRQIQENIPDASVTVSTNRLQTGFLRHQLIEEGGGLTS
ncbi:MAG: hypothetical protein LBC35_01805 [Coriobacteriales bacterium]|jgi:mannose-1-phosphate guanylyltransferase|nr:hypothetical protein [Coriobacteriales bacterium]